MSLPHYQSQVSGSEAAPTAYESDRLASLRLVSSAGEGPPIAAEYLRKRARQEQTRTGLSLPVLADKDHWHLDSPPSVGSATIGVIPDSRGEASPVSEQSSKRRRLLAPPTEEVATTSSVESKVVLGAESKASEDQANPEAPPTTGTSDGTLAWLEAMRTKAAACKEEGDIMLARILLLEALPTASRLVDEGACSPSYLGQCFLAQIADLCYQLGDCAEAIDYYTNAVKHERMAAAQASEGSTNPPKDSYSKRILRHLEAICRIYVEVRQYSYALCVFKEIYDIQLEVIGPNSLEVASTLCNMALMHYMLELYTPSLHFYQETLRISLTLLEEYNQKRTLSVITGMPHHDRSKGYALNKSVGDSLNAMGLLYFKLKRFDEAASAFSCSLGIREKLLGPYHRDVTVLWYNLAMVRVETGDPRRAIPLYEEGLRREQVGLGCNAYHPDLSSTLQYLGEIYNQLGEIDESLVCFQKALEIERRQAARTGLSGPKNTDHWTSVCRLLNVIGNIYLMQANIPATMTCFTEAARTATFLQECGNQYIPLVVAGHMFCHLTRQHPSCASAA